MSSLQRARRVWSMVMGHTRKSSSLRHTRTHLVGTRPSSKNVARRIGSGSQRARSWATIRPPDESDSVPAASSHNGHVERAESTCRDEAVTTRQQRQLLV